MGLKDLTIFHYPLFRRTLFATEKPYFLRRDQNLGEKDLIKICETAKIEYHWTYFKDTNYWLHDICTHKESFDPSSGEVQMLVDYQIADTNSVLGKELAEYHIHPDYPVDYYFLVNPEKQIFPKEVFKSSLVCPSIADLVNSLETPDREYKIATSLGITTYKLHSKELLNLYRSLDQILSNSQRWIFKGMDSFDEWLEGFVKNINKAMQGYATIEFCPKDKI